MYVGKSMFYIPVYFCIFVQGTYINKMEENKMEEKKIGIKHHDSYDVNPSIFEMGKFMVVKDKKMNGKVEGVEPYGDNKLAIIANPDYFISYLKDTRNFIKSYEQEDVILGLLSSIGLDMYRYVRSLARKKVGSDIVTVSWNGFAEFSGKKSKASFYNGLGNLIENQIIFRKKGSDFDYFINLHLFHNGDTANLYEKHMKVMEKIKNDKKERRSKTAHFLKNLDIENTLNIEDNDNSQ
jgi:hypothetical protein